jgi:hypothetical protein
MGCNSAPQDVDKGFAGNIMSFFLILKILIRIPMLKKERNDLKCLENEKLRRICGLYERNYAFGLKSKCSSRT